MATLVCSADGMDSVTVTVTEVENDAVLTLAAGPGGTVQPSGTLVVTQGVAVAISALAADGYAFTGWRVTSGAATLDGTNSAVTTVTIAGPATLQANFVEVAPPSDTVWGWGINTSGQLGDGTTSNRLTPLQAVGLSNITALASGVASFALHSNGTVFAWGSNGYGQLGDGTTSNRLTPLQVAGLSNITALASSGYATYALHSNGTVFAWGYNVNGQLGDGTTSNRSTPVRIAGLSNLTALVSAGTSVYVLHSNGTVFAWGRNNFGQLGDGTTSDRSTPVQVSGLSNIKAIMAGPGLSAYALHRNGTVFAWGYNSYGHLGDGTTSTRLTPVQAVGLSNITAMAVTLQGWTAYALHSNGTVFAWGYSGLGQVGNGTATNRVLSPTQAKLPNGTSLSNVAAVVAGYSSAYALMRDGSAYAWGQNSFGQLGDGTATDRLNPTPVKLGEGSPLSNVAGLVSGPKNAYALMRDGSLYAWGYNNYGQLGDGTTSTRFNPVRVTVDGTTPLLGVASISTDGSSVLVIRLTPYEAWRRAHFTPAQLADLAVSGDDADPDQDGHSNTQEYRAGTDPTDAASRLAFVTPANNPFADGTFVVCWQSATGKVYTLQSTTNPLSGFTNYSTNIPATPMLNVHTDNLNGAAQMFYRVKVE